MEANPFLAHLGIILGSILEAFWTPREYFWYIGTISGRFWSLSKPEGIWEGLRSPRSALGTGSAILASHFREGGPDWKVSQPQGEDNRRGTDTSHTPDDPKGSADFIPGRDGTGAWRISGVVRVMARAWFVCF